MPGDNVCVCAAMHINVSGYLYLNKIQDKKSTT
jgi:hypothetical protein